MAGFITLDHLDLNDDSTASSGECPSERADTCKHCGQPTGDSGYAYCRACDDLLFPKHVRPITPAGAGL